MGAILAFPENGLTDAARMWEHAALEHRRNLQRAFVPDGQVFEPPRPCLAFKELPLSRGAKSAMVALRGAGTNPVLAWLREMDSLRQALKVAA